MAYQLETNKLNQFENVIWELNIDEIDRYVIWEFYGKGLCRYKFINENGQISFVYKSCVLIKPSKLLQPYSNLIENPVPDNLVIGILGNNIFVASGTTHDIDSYTDNQLYVLTPVYLNGIYDFDYGYSKIIDDKYRGLFNTINLDMTRIDNVGFAYKVLLEFNVGNFYKLPYEDMISVLKFTQNKLLNIIQFDRNETIYKWDNNRFVPSKYQPFGTINPPVRIEGDPRLYNVLTLVDFNNGLEFGSKDEESYDRILRDLIRYKSLFHLGRAIGKVETMLDGKLYPYVDITLKDLIEM